MPQNPSQVRNTLHPIENIGIISLSGLVVLNAILALLELL